MVGKKIDIPRKLHVTTRTRRKKTSATVVLLHGIGSSGHMWRKVEEAIPDDVQIVSIDLLGFGASPKPARASYSVRVQARSVALTLFRLRLRGRIVVVGHSMGSLIAIELAKRYPLFIRGLILCSPPIYRSKSERTNILATEHRLERLYARATKLATKQPERVLRAAHSASKHRLTHEGFVLDETTLTPYLTALQYAIINQSSYKDIQQIRCPVDIIYGSFDPVIVPANYRRLKRTVPQLQTRRIAASHDITAAYVSPIVRAVDRYRRSTGGRLRV